MDAKTAVAPLLFAAAALVATALATTVPAQAGGTGGAEQDQSAARVPNPKVLMKTSLGDITLELFANETPKTVANFIGLAEGTREFVDPKTRKRVKRPFYDGLSFHRVMSGFMAQGGDPLGDGTGGPGYTFEDEINARSLGLDKVKAFENGRPHPALNIGSARDYDRIVRAPLYAKMGITSQKELDARRDEVRKAEAALTLMDVFVNQGYRYHESRPSHPVRRGTIAMANAGPNSNGSQFFISMRDNDYLNGKHTVFGRVIDGMQVIDKMQRVKVIGQSRPKEKIVILSVRKVGEIPVPAPGEKTGGKTGR